MAEDLGAEVIANTSVVGGAIGATVIAHATWPGSLIRMVSSDPEARMKRA